MDDILRIGPYSINPGERVQLELPAVKLYTDTEISIPIHVMRSKKPGPTIFVSAAVHGDELNGIEIVKRLITKKNLKLLCGSLIAVPMVNIYGVLNQSRYMPDRRDLNRSFPGSKKGSLSGRFAHLFLNEIVQQCQYGIDLHTGAIHRSNLPQIRADISDQETKDLAMAFGLPVIINSNIRDGSMRQAAVESGIKMLVYEAGEALRFDELSIRAGLKGVLNILSHLQMLKPTLSKNDNAPYISKNSNWVRAPSSGIVRNVKKLGAQVKKGDKLAEISDPFGNIVSDVYTEKSGIIIGRQNIPLVQEGDAMYHIAYFNEPGEVAENIEQMSDELLD